MGQQESKLQDKTVVLVAHRVFPSIVDDLKKFLLDKHCGELWYLIHEFMNLKTRRSFIEHFRRGTAVGIHFSFDYRSLPEPFVNIKDFVYSLYWLLFKVKRADLYIGLGGFDVLPGILLRRYLGLRNIVFYTIDYVPVRFASRPLNAFYHFVDRFALRHSTVTWNLSPRMAEGREKLKGLKREDFPNQVVVPHGLWTDGINRYDFDEINKSELIFIGHIVEKAGVQLVIEAMPAILKKVPEFQFRVIGTGPYENELKQLARALGVESNVMFEGPVPDQEVANDKLARAAAAVAMYDSRADDFSYYADPGKLKTYLACGLPILLTEVPHNAREIEAQMAGKVIDYDKDVIADAVVELFEDKNMLRKYRENAARYAEQFDWNSIFSKNLERLL